MLGLLLTSTGLKLAKMTEWLGNSGPEEEVEQKQSRNSILLAENKWTVLFSYKKNVGKTVKNIT